MIHDHKQKLATYTATKMAKHFCWPSDLLVKLTKFIKLVINNLAKAGLGRNSNPKITEHQLEVHWSYGINWKALDQVASTRSQMTTASNKSFYHSTLSSSQLIRPSTESVELRVSTDSQLSIKASTELQLTAVHQPKTSVLGMPEVDMALR